jgi:hypothetical protein
MTVPFQLQQREEVTFHFSLVKSYVQQANTARRSVSSDECNSTLLDTFIDCTGSTYDQPVQSCGM